MCHGGIWYRRVYHVSGRGFRRRVWFVLERGRDERCHGEEMQWWRKTLPDDSYLLNGGLLGVLELLASCVCNMLYVDIRIHAHVHSIGGARIMGRREGEGDGQGQSLLQPTCFLRCRWMRPTYNVAMGGLYVACEVCWRHTQIREREAACPTRKLETSLMESDPLFYPLTWVLKTHALQPALPPTLQSCPPNLRWLPFFHWLMHFFLQDRLPSYGTNSSESTVRLEPFTFLVPGLV